MGKSTSDVRDVAGQMGHNVEGMARNFGGGVRKLQLALEMMDRDWLYSQIDELAMKRERMLPLLERGPRFTVQVGQFKAPDDLIAAMDAAGVKYVSDDEQYVKDLVRRIELTQTQGSAEGYRVTSGDVGNTDWTRWDVYYPQTEALGFGDVVQEFGALVALKCARQLQNGEPCDLEVGEWFIACSKPIVDANGRLRLLYVKRHGDGVYLYWDDGYRGREVRPGDQCLRSRK